MLVPSPFNDLNADEQYAHSFLLASYVAPPFDSKYVLLASHSHLYLLVLVPFPDNDLNADEQYAHAVLLASYVAPPFGSKYVLFAAQPHSYLFVLELYINFTFGSLLLHS